MKLKQVLVGGCRKVLSELTQKSGNEFNFIWECADFSKELEQLLCELTCHNLNFTLFSMGKLSVIDDTW